MQKLVKRYDGVMDNTVSWLIEAIVINKPRKMIMDKASITNDFIIGLVDALLTIPTEDQELQVLSVSSNMIFGEGIISIAKLVDANLPTLVNIQARNQGRTLGSKEAKILLQALKDNRFLKKLGLDFRTSDIAEVNKLLSRNARHRFSMPTPPSSHIKPSIRDNDSRRKTETPPMKLPESRKRTDLSPKYTRSAPITPNR